MVLTPQKATSVLFSGVTDFTILKGDPYEPGGLWSPIYNDRMFFLRKLMTSHWMFLFCSPIFQTVWPIAAMFFPVGFLAFPLNDLGEVRLFYHHEPWLRWKI